MALDFRNPVPQVKPVITHRFHHTEFEHGFVAMLSGQSGKVILDWGKK